MLRDVANTSGCGKARLGSSYVRGVGWTEDIAGPDYGVMHSLLGGVADHAIGKEQPGRVHDAHQEAKQNNAHHGEFHKALSALFFFVSS